MTAPDTRDSVERIVLEMRAHRVMGSRIAELDEWATRLQALDRQRQEGAVELAADRDSWRDQASDRLKEWDAMRIRAEAVADALAEARELLQQVETFTAYANCDTCCEMNALARAFLTRTAKEPSNA